MSLEDELGWNVAMTDEETTRFHARLAALLDGWMGRTPLDPKAAAAYPPAIISMSSPWFEHCEASSSVDGPASADEFVSWFHHLVETNPTLHHPLYPYIEEQAGEDEFRFFVAQETSVDRDFADLIALVQVGLPNGPKVVVAENYWDEMGRGDRASSHEMLFREMARSIRIIEDDVVPTAESLACGNALRVMAMFHSYRNACLGALAITEAGVPARFAKVMRGAERLGLPEPVLHYYSEHVTGDESHAADWLDRVILPLIEADPTAIDGMLAGIRIRLAVSEQYCDELLAALTEPSAARLVEAGCD